MYETVLNLFPYLGYPYTISTMCSFQRDAPLCFSTLKLPGLSLIRLRAVATVITGFDSLGKIMPKGGVIGRNLLERATNSQGDIESCLFSGGMSRATMRSATDAWREFFRKSMEFVLELLRSPGIMERSCFLQLLPQIVQTLAIRGLDVRIELALCCGALARWSVVR